MNYFAHGRAFIDDPYRLAGTAVPDWLNVADRRVRVRPARAAELVADDDPRVAAVAQGILQHFEDDAWFHASRAFAELSLAFTVLVRDGLPRDEGFRPSFLGHILVELLLDASLAAQDPKRLSGYYGALEQIDPALVQQTVGRIAGQPADGLRWFIPAFCRERFLWDYSDDAKLWTRLNQVLRRVKLPVLPTSFCDLLPEARRQVEARRAELLPSTSKEGGPQISQIAAD